jgi:iron-sulfur cluster insertion protein
MTDLAPLSAPQRPDARAVRLTERASRRIRDLAGRQQAGSRFRISVSGGGCSGFQYGFGFDDTLTDDDRLFEQNGVTVVVDDMSLDLLDGAELDYVEELIGASFQVRNPNASSSCGCGSSFSV